MPILDIFKKKKSKEKPSFVKAAEGKEKKEQKSEQIKTEAQKPKKIKGLSATAYRILKSLHVTEKATDLSKNNQYVFEVFPKANKSEIKKAIEGTFNVDVIRINIVKTPGKKRRLGRTFGWKEGYKKAIIKVKEGQKIDISPK